MKKYRFYQDEIRFLGYVIFLQRINIEAKKIKLIKNWPKPKSVHNIQVFLGFANFYQRFIQGFSRIVISLTSIMKTTGSLDKPASNRNNGSKSAFSRNDNSRLVSGRNNSNGEVNRSGVSENDVEHAKKSGKLSKSKNLSKSK